MKSERRRARTGTEIRAIMVQFFDEFMVAPGLQSSEKRSDNTILLQHQAVFLLIGNKSSSVENDVVFVETTSTIS